MISSQDWKSRWDQEGAARLIERANDISIFKVLADVFNIYHPPEGRSYKGYCPFAWEHPDGGLDKGFRTYPSTNSAHCFVMHGYLGPVKLVQIGQDLRPVEAAKWLLREYGLLKPRSYQARFAEVREEMEARERSIGSTAYLVEALQSYLARVPGYEDKQFSSQVAGVMEEELERLDALLVSPGDPRRAVRDWYYNARRHLTQVVEEV
jgi:hypothetical protein